MHSGAISLSVVCGSMVLAQSRFRRQIGTESCYRVGSQAYRREVLSTGVGRRYIGATSCLSIGVLVRQLSPL